MKRGGNLSVLRPVLILVLAIFFSQSLSASRLMSKIFSRDFEIPEQAVGFYSKGSLINGMALPYQGEGYVKLFQKSQRPYGAREFGTWEILKMIRELGEVFSYQFESRDQLMIGDISGEVGGEISQHASHQIGLDVDIALVRKNQTMQDVTNGSGDFTEFFVKEGKPTENFDLERNWFVIKSIVSSSQVSRIFIDGVLKKAICDYSKSINEYQDHQEVLRKLRHWPDHQDHIHVRLNCPETSPKCISQDPPPEGSGCDQAFEVNESEVGE